jgi:hypothetical protein
VVTPASPVRPPREGTPGIDVAFPLLSLGAHPACRDHNVPTALAVGAGGSRAAARAGACAAAQGG